VRTKVRGIASLPLGAVSLVAVAASVLLLLARVAGGQPNVGWPSEIPPDMTRLGVTAAPAEAHPLMSADSAVDAARLEAPGLLTLPGAKVDTYLTVDSGGALTWIVRVSGFEFEQPGPPDEFGSPAPGHVIRYGYVYVDDAGSSEPLIILKQ